MDSYFKEKAEQVQHAMLKGIDPNKGKLEHAIHYALSVRGKRLRPIIFLTMLDGCGICSPDYIDIAAAIEYIHTYSLIHDDLPAMDNDDMRRGMPTVHCKFDEAIALLAGDTLLTMAFEKISGHRKADSRTLVNIIRIITECIGIHGMAGGQALDLEFNGDSSGILNIHYLKTARLISGTMLAAAEIADLEQNQKDLVQRAGNHIGIAFQLADDLLDMEGDEHKVGKKLNKDKSNQSPNSVLYFGRQYVTDEIDRYFKKTMQDLVEARIDSPRFNELMKMMVYREK